jgi:glycosyltransferase involved in cell wall biosynthesis
VPSVSVVLPIRNEALNLPFVLDALPSLVDEVIVVDGGSTDHSIATVKEHRPDAIIIGQHSPGKGAASIAGLEAASGDIVVLMDADNSMDPRDIEGMISLLEAGADIVHGSREASGGGSSDFTFVRRLGNDLLTKSVNLLFGVSWTDLTFGYVALWRRVHRELHIESLILDQPAPRLEGSKRSGRPNGYGHGFEVEVLILCRAARHGMKVAELPCFEHKRRHGTSNLNALRDGLRVVGAIITERLSNARATAPARRAAKAPRPSLDPDGLSAAD